MNVGKCICGNTVQLSAIYRALNHRGDFYDVCKTKNPPRFPSCAGFILA